MNCRGELTLAEGIGIVLFILASVFVFFPLGSKAYAIFKGVPDEEKASGKLGEILDKIVYMVENNAPSSMILMDTPLNWFLVGAGDKLCICKNLATNDEIQEEICEKYGGVCSEFKYEFEIDNLETKRSRILVFVGRQNAIKLEGDNFMTIRKDENNFFTFRKSSAETNLNDVLNDYLSSKIIVDEIQYSVEEFIKIACEKPSLFSNEIFKSSFESFFNQRVLEKSFIRLSFQRDKSRYVGSVMFDFYYPVSGKNINFDSGLIIKHYDFKTQKDLGEHCIVEMASTTSSLNSGDSNE